MFFKVKNAFIFYFSNTLWRLFGIFLMITLALFPTFSLAQDSPQPLSKEDLKLLKIGAPPSWKWDHIDRIIKVFRKFDRQEASYTSPKGLSKTCKMFFKNNKLLNKQSLGILEDAAELGDDLLGDDDFYHHARARLEILRDYMDQQLHMARANAEGYISPTGTQNLPCPIPNRIRWIENQDRRVKFLYLALATLWPTRGIRNNYDLSRWLAQKQVERADSARFKSGSLVLLGIASWPISIWIGSKVAVALGYSAATGKIAAKAAPAVAGAALGGLNKYKEAQQKQLQDDATVTQNNFNQFLKMPFDSTELYFQIIYENEIFNGIISMKDLEEDLMKRRLLEKNSLLDR